MDVFNFPIAIDDQGRRMCDVDRIHAQLVIQPISLGHRAVLIEQKGIRRQRDAIAKTSPASTPPHFSPPRCTPVALLPARSQFSLAPTEPCVSRSSVTRCRAGTPRSERRATGNRKERKSRHGSPPPTEILVPVSRLPEFLCDRTSCCDSRAQAAARSL